MADPLQQASYGDSDDRQERLTMAPSSSSTLSSQVVVSEPSPGALSQVDSETGVTPLNTPVSTVSRSTKKTAGESVNSVTPSASSSSSEDVELQAVRREAASAGPLPDGFTLRDGEKDSVGGKEPEPEKKKVTWFQAGAGKLLPTAS